jgi:beta-galactosidase/beta-glucuronidase
MPLGDWSQRGALAEYSGGVWYRKSVVLSDEQTQGRVTLDLGAVAASAEVIVNGKPAGIRVTPPWRVDVSGLVTPGENRVEVLVCNTLANHYGTIPTHYRGDPVSGLLGPVTLSTERAVELK